MRRVWSVSAENTTGRNHSQWRSATLHRVNLYGGSLGTQSETIAGVKSILRSTRRVVLRNIKSVEIIEVSLNFPAILNRIPKRDENVFNSFSEYRNRMKVSAARTPARERYVDGFALSLLSLRVDTQNVSWLLELLFNIQSERLHLKRKRWTILHRDASD